MRSMRQMVRRPSRAFEDASDELYRRTRQLAKRPFATGGVILLILGVIGFIWLFPELQRYARIERM